MLYGSNGKGREIRPTHLFPVVQIDPLPGLMAQEGISGNKADQVCSAPTRLATASVCAVIYHSNESPTLSTNPPTEPVYWRTHQPVLDRCAWNSLKVIEFVMAVPRRQIKAICMHTAAESHSGNQADEACIQRDAYSLKRFIVPLRHTHGRHRS